MPKCDFVIVTRNLRLAERCVASIQESCKDYLGSIIMVMRPETQFTTGADQGWRAGREDFVCFVNDDAFPTGKALRRMFEVFDYEENVGAVGPSIPCRSHQGSTPPSDKPLAVEVPFLVSGMLLTKKSILEEVGGWDTKFILYACDIDLGFRIRDAGYRLMWARDAWVNHIVGSSEHKVENRADISDQDNGLLKRKHPGRFERECQIIPTEPVCERPVPGADGFAQKRYEMAKEGMNGAVKVLDLGCAYGTGARVFADRSYVGWEIDEQCVAYAKKHLPGVFQVGRVDDAPLAQNHFDAVCAFEVIEHVENPQQMLQNAADALVEGGKMWLSTPQRRGVFNPHHLREWTEQELEALLKAYFHDVTVEVRDYGFMAPTLWAECANPIKPEKPVRIEREAAVG